METHPDLFGGETPIVTPVYVGQYAKFKQWNCYRKGTREQNCSKCEYMFRNGYRKCRLMGCS